MHRLPPLLLISILLLFAGCAPTPQYAPPPIEDSLSVEASALAERGEFLAAAQLYLSASKSTPEKQRAPLHLQAATYLARGQLWEQLATVLATIDPRTLNEEQQVQFLLLNAELALSERRFETALGELDKITNADSLPDHGQQYYRLRARAYAMSGNPLEAARQLIWLDGLLSDAQLQLENQYAIWEQISGLSDQALQQLRTMPPPDVLSGWMELVQIAREYRGKRQQWLAALEDWRARYPGHPAENALLPALQEQIQQFGTTANQIAVLLPLSGRAAESAAAIRDGLLAAYFEDQDERPEIRLYDTAGDAQLLWSVYQRAVEEGAEFVIGPLFKTSIQQLARSGQLAVPVLALNHTETEQPVETSLYQFGLAPEDEARQVAERMYADGHEHVVAFYPDTPWGGRVFAAFADQLQLLGGKVLEAGRYAANNPDFKAPIQQALNLDASKNRHQALQRLFGQSLQFEPRRRQDAEAIFLLGFPPQARLLRPQLNFHHAGDVPVYSTSHVFSGNAAATLDRDMDGLYFCDIPWILDQTGEWAAKREQLKTAWPKRSQNHQRLFALGFDAYQILPWLDGLNTPGFGYFPGATGILTLDQHKVLHRKLEWAQFRAGLPEKLETP